MILHAGPKKKVQKRATKLSAMEMLADKYSKKAENKKEKLELRRMELEFAKEKYAAEAEERKARMELELEEKRAFLAVLKKSL